MPPSARRMAMIRRVGATYLADTCTIKGMAGTPTRTFQTLATLEPCLVGEASYGNVPAELEYVAGISIFWIKLRLTAPLEKDYQVTWQSGVYQVIALDRNRTNALFKRGWMREISAP